MTARIAVATKIREDAGQGMPDLHRQLPPGAAVIDVGTRRGEDGLHGDVEFGPVAGVAAASTPLPGGAGPMTIAILLATTRTAARVQQGVRN